VVAGGSYSKTFMFMFQSSMFGTSKTRYANLRRAGRSMSVCDQRLVWVHTCMNLYTYVYIRVCANLCRAGNLMSVCDQRLAWIHTCMHSYTYMYMNIYK